MRAAPVLVARAMASKRRLAPPALAGSRDALLGFLPPAAKLIERACYCRDAACRDTGIGRRRIELVVTQMNGPAAVPGISKCTFGTAG